MQDDDATLCGLETTGNGRQQGGRLEGLLQAPDRAKLGRHGQEIRAGAGIRT